MTMLIELDSDNRASLRRLFDRYPCLHGSVAAVIEGGMRRVFADAQEEPCVALARQLGFHSTGKYEAYRLKQPEGKSAAR